MKKINAFFIVLFILMLCFSSCFATNSSNNGPAVCYAWCIDEVNSITYDLCYSNGKVEQMSLQGEELQNAISSKQFVFDAKTAEQVFVTLYTDDGYRYPQQVLINSSTSNEGSDNLTTTIQLNSSGIQNYPFGFSYSVSGGVPPYNISFLGHIVVSDGLTMGMFFSNNECQYFTNSPSGSLSIIGDTDLNDGGYGTIYITAEDSQGNICEGSLPINVSN